MIDADVLTKQIEKYVSQLRDVGWCVVEGVIPENEVDAIRQHVETAHLEAIELNMRQPVDRSLIKGTRTGDRVRM